MQVQLTTNKQNSNPAFGRLYKFTGSTDCGKELYRILKEKGATPPRDFIGGEIFCDNSIFHLATGEDSFAPPAFMSMTNGLCTLSEKVKAAGKNVIEIFLDYGKRIEDQLNISLRTIGEDGKQEIDIVKK